MFLQNSLHSLPNSRLIIHGFHVVMGLVVLYMSRNPQLITRNVLNVVSIVALLAVVYHGSVLFKVVMGGNGNAGNGNSNVVVLPNGNVVDANVLNAVNAANANAGNVAVNGNVNGFAGY